MKQELLNTIAGSMPEQLVTGERWNRMKARFTETVLNGLYSSGAEELYSVNGQARNLYYPKELKVRNKLSQNPWFMIWRNLAFRRLFDDTYEPPTEDPVTLLAMKKMAQGPSDVDVFCPVT